MSIRHSLFCLHSLSLMAPIPMLALALRPAYLLPTLLLTLGTVVLTIVLGAAALPAQAQAPDPAPDTTWTYDVTGRLSAAQAAYRNWQEGGLNTLSVSSSIDGRAIQRTTRWKQTYEMRLVFGIIQQDTLAVRKSEDLIRLGAALQYRGDGFFRVFNPTIAAGLRTQFAEGLDYEGDPFGEGREPPVKSSDFFAPATITQSLGLIYTPSDWVSQRISAAGKQTVVTIDRLRPLYDVNVDDVARWEAGVESVTALDRELFENVRLQSTLTTFLAVNQPEPPDVLWENLLTMQVNSWLSTQVEYVLLYDDNTSTAVQMKEVLSVGVTFSIL